MTKKLNILDAWDLCRGHWGTALGTGWVPAIPCVGAYTIMHGALEGVDGWRYWGLLFTLAGCMLFSVRTVWLFGEGLFGEPVKAALLVISLEGLMAFMPETHGWLSQVALAALIGINAVANVCHTVSQRTRTQNQTSDEPELLPEPQDVPALSRALRTRKARA